MALAGKYGFLAQIPSISKIKNSITETSRHHYKQLAKAQQTKVISTGLWDINLLYARTCFQADKNRLIGVNAPAFRGKTSNQGRSIAIFILRNKVEKVESACHGWHQLKRLLPDQAASAKCTPKYRIANYKLHAKQKSRQKHKQKKLSGAVWLY